MNAAVVGWALALAAIVAGYVGYGWRGVVLAITIVVFWLALQFSRAVRALRDAAGRPVGEIDSAVMLHSRLQAGMRLVQILKLTRSLGLRIAEDPETYEWRDGGGDCVRVQLQRGRLDTWTLQRAYADGSGFAAGGP